MNKTFALLTLASLSCAGLRAETDFIEKAIRKNDPKMVKAVSKWNAQQKVRLTAAKKAEYVELAKAQVEKKNAILQQPKVSALLNSLDGHTVLKETVMLAGGILLAWHAIGHATAKDPKETDPAKKDELRHEWHVTPHKWLGTFAIGIGQSYSSLITLYKTIWQTDKAKTALENAEQVLVLVEELPAA